MPKPWQAPTGRISSKNRSSFSEVVRDLRYCVFSVNRYRADPPGQDQRFRIWSLGSGFFVTPHVFLTCNHVINGVRLPHQAGDKYQIVQNLGQRIKASPLFNLTVGTDLKLFPDRDLALLTLPGEPQPYASISYSDAAEGDEIGVAGYPLAEIMPGPNGEPQFQGAIYRVAKGVITSALRQRLNPAPDPPTGDLNTVEVNFLFVLGNSGGPIFDANSGRVLGFVHGFRDREIVQRYVDSNQENVAAGAPAKHMQALHAVYSLGIKLDNVRTELEREGATL